MKHISIKSSLFLIFFFIVVSLVPAGQAHAAVLYDRSAIGTSYMVANQNSGATPAANMIQEPGNTSGSPTFFDSTQTPVYTATYSGEYIVRVLNAGTADDCSQLALWGSGGDEVYQDSGLTETSAGGSAFYCDFTYYLPSGYGFIYFVPNHSGGNGWPDNVGQEMEGSPSNSGIQYGAGSPNYPSAGGIALQICDSSGCTGGFTPSSGGTTDACSAGSLGTCITDVVPTTGTTTATSTSIGATVYVSPSDYKDGMTLNMEFYSPTQAAVGDFVIQAVDQNVPGADSKTVSVPLASGLNTISTTTEFMAVGHWLGTYSVDSPTFLSQLWLIGSLFSPSVLAQAKNDFIVVASTGLDSAIAQGGAAITTYLTTGTTTNSSGQNIDVLDCDFGTSFSLTACLVSIIIPDATSTSAFITGFQGTFLQRVPFGYVTRFVTILNTTSTSTLPGLVVTLPPNFPGAGETFDLTPWNELMSSTTMFSTATSSSGDGKTFRQIVEPGWDILVLSIFTFFIIHRLLGIDAQKDSKNTT